VKRVGTADSGRQLVLAAVLLVEIAFFSLQADGFLETSNLLNAVRYTAVFLVVGVGTTFGLVSGAIDISMAATIALSGSLATRVVAAGGTAAAGIGACLAIGALVGLANGLVVVKLRVNPLVATLGMMGIARGAGFWLEGPGHRAWQFHSEDPVFLIFQRDLLGVPVPVVFAALVVALGHLLLSHTRLGQYAYAVGGNPESARSAALPVDGLRIFLLVLSGFCAGIGGWMMASMLGGTQVTIAGGWELTIITAVIFGGVGLAGGTGSMVGTFLGTLILGFMVNGMSLAGWYTYQQYIAQGLLLLFALGVDALRSGGYR